MSSPSSPILSLYPFSFQSILIDLIRHVSSQHNISWIQTSSSSSSSSSSSTSPKLSSFLSNISFSPNFHYVILSLLQQFIYLYPIGKHSKSSASPSLSFNPKYIIPIVLSSPSSVNCKICISSIDWIPFSFPSPSAQSSSSSSLPSPLTDVSLLSLTSSMGEWYVYHISHATPTLLHYQHVAYHMGKGEGREKGNEEDEEENGEEEEESELNNGFGDRDINGYKMRRRGRKLKKVKIVRNYYTHKDNIIDIVNSATSSSSSSAPSNAPYHPSSLPPPSSQYDDSITPSDSPMLSTSLSSTISPLFPSSSPLWYHDMFFLFSPRLLIHIDGKTLYKSLSAVRDNSNLRESNTSDPYDFSPLPIRCWRAEDQLQCEDIMILTKPLQLGHHEDLLITNHMAPSSLLSSSPSSLSPSLSLYNGTFPSFLVVGSEPFLAYYQITDQTANSLHSSVSSTSSIRLGMDLAKKVKSAVKSAVFGYAKSWWSGGGGNGGEQPENNNHNSNTAPSIPPAKPLALPFSYCLRDSGRLLLTIHPSPSHSFALLTDTFGRIFLVECGSGTIRKIWKGYRDAQVVWGKLKGEERNIMEREAERGKGERKGMEMGKLQGEEKRKEKDQGKGNVGVRVMAKGKSSLSPRQLPDNMEDDDGDDADDDAHDSPSSSSLSPLLSPSLLFIFIYAPRRGLLEVWNTLTLQRISVTHIGYTYTLKSIFVNNHGEETHIPIIANTITGEISYIGMRLPPPPVSLLPAIKPKLSLDETNKILFLNIRNYISLMMEEMERMKEEHESSHEKGKWEECELERRKGRWKWYKMEKDNNNNENSNSDPSSSSLFISLNSLFSSFCSSAIKEFSSSSPSSIDMSSLPSSYHPLSPSASIQMSVLILLSTIAHPTYSSYIPCRHPYDNQKHRDHRHGDGENDNDNDNFIPPTSPSLRTVTFDERNPSPPLSPSSSSWSSTSPASSPVFPFPLKCFLSSPSLFSSPSSVSDHQNETCPLFVQMVLSAAIHSIENVIQTLIPSSSSVSSSDATLSSEDRKSDAGDSLSLPLLSSNPRVTLNYQWNTIVSHSKPTFTQLVIMKKDTPNESIDVESLFRPQRNIIGRIINIPSSLPTSLLSSLTIILDCRHILLSLHHIIESYMNIIDLHQRSYQYPHRNASFTPSSHRCQQHFSSLFYHSSSSYLSLYDYLSFYEMEWTDEKLPYDTILKEEEKRDINKNDQCIPLSYDQYRIITRIPLFSTPAQSSSVSSSSSSSSSVSFGLRSPTLSSFLSFLFPSRLFFPSLLFVFISLRLSLLHVDDIISVIIHYVQRMSVRDLENMVELKKINNNNNIQSEESPFPSTNHYNLSSLLLLLRYLSSTEMYSSPSFHYHFLSLMHSFPSFIHLLSLLRLLRSAELNSNQYIIDNLIVAAAKRSSDGMTENDKGDGKEGSGIMKSISNIGSAIGGLVGLGGKDQSDNQLDVNENEKKLEAAKNKELTEEEKEHLEWSQSLHLLWTRELSLMISMLSVLPPPPPPSSPSTPHSDSLSFPTSPISLSYRKIYRHLSQLLSLRSNIPLSTVSDTLFSIDLYRRKYPLTRLIAIHMMNGEGSRLLENANVAAVTASATTSASSPPLSSSSSSSPSSSSSSLLSSTSSYIPKSHFQDKLSSFLSILQSDIFKSPYLNDTSHVDSGIIFSSLSYDVKQHIEEDKVHDMKMTGDLSSLIFYSAITAMERALGLRVGMGISSSSSSSLSSDRSSSVSWYHQCVCYVEMLTPSSLSTSIASIVWGEIVHPVLQDIIRVISDTSLSGVPNTSLTSPTAASSSSPSSSQPSKGRSMGGVSVGATVVVPSSSFDFDPLGFSALSALSQKAKSTPLHSISRALREYDHRCGTSKSSLSSSSSSPRNGSSGGGGSTHGRPLIDFNDVEALKKFLIISSRLSEYLLKCWKCCDEEEKREGEDFVCPALLAAEGAREDKEVSDKEGKEKSPHHIHIYKDNREVCDYASTLCTSRFHCHPLYSHSEDMNIEYSNLPTPLFFSLHHHYFSLVSSTPSPSPLSSPMYLSTSLQFFSLLSVTIEANLELFLIQNQFCNFMLCFDDTFFATIKGDKVPSVRGKVQGKGMGRGKDKGERVGMDEKHVKTENSKYNFLSAPYDLSTQIEKYYDFPLSPPYDFSDDSESSKSLHASPSISLHRKQLRFIRPRRKQTEKVQNVTVSSQRLSSVSSSPPTPTPTVSSIDRHRLNFLLLLLRERSTLLSSPLILRLFSSFSFSPSYRECILREHFCLMYERGEDSRAAELINKFRDSVCISTIMILIAKTRITLVIHQWQKGNKELYDKVISAVQSEMWEWMAKTKAPVVLTLEKMEEEENNGTGGLSYSTGGRSSPQSVSSSLSLSSSSSFSSSPYVSIHSESVLRHLRDGVFLPMELILNRPISLSSVKQKTSEIDLMNTKILLKRAKGLLQIHAGNGSGNSGSGHDPMFHPVLYAYDYLCKLLEICSLIVAASKGL